MIKKSAKSFFVAVLLVFVVQFSAPAKPGLPEVPVKGMVTMVDLGAKKCIPCKMMAPILVELEKEYKDRAAIVFIDVRQQENKPFVNRFGIKAIPTQIFFDKDGREISRHVGFMNKKSIVATLEKLGVERPPKTEPSEKR